MGVTEISLLAGAPHANRAEAASARDVAAEFDAMIWGVLLRESGMLRAFGGEEGAENALLGELFAHDFARQLAAQMDIGFGRMALAAAEMKTEGAAK